MTSDTRSFVSACTTCARNKTSSHPQAGLLRLLPVPSHPWSHIALDFVTGLPPSNGMTIVLTIVDRFSKAVTLLPCPSSSRPGRPLISWSATFSTSMESLWTSCLTEVPSLCPRCEGPFARPLGQRSAHPLGFIPRPMVKRKASTRRWKLHSAASPLLGHPPGASTCHGWNTPITPWSTPLQGCPPSCALWATNHPCSLHRKTRPLCLWCRTICASASESGVQPGLRFCAPLPHPSAWRSEEHTSELQSR